MALNSEELAAASRLLDEALALAPVQRAAWLQALPAEHADLVPALREVLARAASASGLLLDRPPRLPERRGSERSEISALKPASASVRTNSFASLASAAWQKCGLHGAPTVPTSATSL